MGIANSKAKLIFQIEAIHVMRRFIGQMLRAVSATDPIKFKFC